MYPPKPDVYPSSPSTATAPVQGIPVRSPPFMAPATHQSQWTSGLCGCTDDCSDSCLSCLCPCITFGQIAEILDKGSPPCGMSGALYGVLCLFTGCHWIYSCTYRSKLRAQYNLRDSPCGDCLVHFCCEPCSLCQMHRELKRKGFIMNLGWLGNSQSPEVAANQPPYVQGGMFR